VVDPTRWEELLAWHAVDALTPAQSQELAIALADPAAAAAFRDAARFHRLLAAALSAPSAPDLAARVEVILHSRRASQRSRTATGILQRLSRRRRLVVAAVAALVLLGVVLAGFSFAARRGVEGPVVVEDGAGVVIERQGQPSTDLRLRIGDRLRTAAGATAVLRYEDGTRLALSQDATCVVDGAKALALDHGRLEAAVAHQPAGTALVVHTPQAEVIVVGTRFILAVDAARTLLTVSQGVVRMVPHGGSTASGPMEVAAGAQAEADALMLTTAQTTAPGTGRVAVLDATTSQAHPMQPCAGWTANRHGDPVELRTSAQAGSVDYSYDHAGPRGYSAIRHGLRITPADRRLTCLVEVERCDPGAILSLQAVTRDGGAWYLGHVELHRQLGAGWFRFSVPVQVAVKKNSPTGAAPYQPGQVIACTLGISAGAAAIRVTPPVLTSTPPPGDAP